MYLSFRPSQTTGPLKAVETFGADPLVDPGGGINLFGLPTIGEAGGQALQIVGGALGGNFINTF